MPQLCLEWSLGGWLHRGLTFQPGRKEHHPVDLLSWVEAIHRSRMPLNSLQGVIICRGNLMMVVACIESRIIPHFTGIKPHTCSSPLQFPIIPLLSSQFSPLLSMQPLRCSPLIPCHASSIPATHMFWPERGIRRVIIPRLLGSTARSSRIRRLGWLRWLRRLGGLRRL